MYMCGPFFWIGQPGGGNTGQRASCSEGRNSLLSVCARCPDWEGAGQPRGGMAYSSRDVAERLQRILRGGHERRGPVLGGYPRSVRPWEVFGFSSGWDGKERGNSRGHGKNILLAATWIGWRGCWGPWSWHQPAPEGTFSNPGQSHLKMKCAFLSAQVRTIKIYIRKRRHCVHEALINDPSG